MSDLPTPSDDLIEIVNNKWRTYEVSKRKLCSTIPYFEKMFSGRFIESEKRKFEFNLDEQGFHIIMVFAHYDCVFRYSCIDILRGLHVADYLSMDETLISNLEEIFYKDFTIVELPVILNYFMDNPVNLMSTKINKNSIEYFICKYFRQIIETDTFLKFPIETVEYILQLDLIVDSEYQIFEAIELWITFDADRMSNLEQLLYYLRWEHIDTNTLEKIKESTIMIEIKLDIDDYDKECPPRTKKPSLTVIYEIDETNIEIHFYDENLEIWCLWDRFVLDQSLPTNIIADESFHDIIYGSGRKIIRVDWNNKKFKCLEMEENRNSFIFQIYRYIMSYDFQRPGARKRKTKYDYGYKFLYMSHTNLVSNDFIATHYFPEHVGRIYESRFIDSFDLFGRIFHVLAYRPDEELFYPCFITTIVDGTIYAVKDDLEYLIFKQSTGEMISHDLKDTEFQFHDLELLSHGGKFYLCDKSRKEVYTHGDEILKLIRLFVFENDRNIIGLASTYLNH